MPRKIPLPAHLAAFLEALEAQDAREQPDRLAALDAAETVAGRQISIEDAKRNPEFKKRYNRWEERLRLAMQDAQIGRVMAGKSSATPLIAALEMNRAGSDGGAARTDGRTSLGRHHAGRKNDFSRW